MLHQIVYGAPDVASDILACAILSDSVGIHLYELFEGLCVVFGPQHAHGLLKGSNSWEYELLCTHDIFWIAHLQNKQILRRRSTEVSGEWQLP